MTPWRTSAFLCGAPLSANARSKLKSASAACGRPDGAEMMVDVDAFRKLASEEPLAEQKNMLTLTICNSLTEINIYLKM